MPDGPWTKYQQPTQQADGPWSKYGTAPQSLAPQDVMKYTLSPPDPNQPAMQPKPSAFYGDLKSMVMGIPKAAYNIANPAAGASDAMERAKQIIPDYQARRAEGRSIGYSALAPVAEQLGTNVKGMEQSAREGDQLGIVGHGMAAATPYIAGAVGGKLLEPVMDAEHNPNTVYHRYLDSAGHVPESMPVNPEAPKIPDYLANKVGINHKSVADRMRSGNTTLGDLDVARIEGGKASQAAYTTTGKPTPLVEGYKNISDALRDTIYPKLEALHNLDPGTLGGIKRLEGRLIRMGPEPELNTANPNKGGVVSYAIQKGITRPITRAVTGLQTRLADMSLPEPQSIDLRRNFPPPSGKLVKSIQPASVEIGGPQEVSGRPPQTTHTVAAPEHEPIRPALYEPPPNNAVHPIEAPPEGGARIPKVAPQTKPLPALPKEMLNLPPNILDAIEEMHRKGQLVPPRSK